MEQFEENNYQDYTSQFALQNADAAGAANRYESPRNSNGLAIASLVLGISSIVTCCCCPILAWQRYIDCNYCSWY